MQNLGSDYLDHYEKYFGTPVYRDVVDADDMPRKIQLLRYTNVFQGCVTFATLGLSSYSNELGGEYCEIVIVVDDCIENIPKIVFSVVRTIIFNKHSLHWGDYFVGLEDVDSEFVSKTGKDTFYVTLPSPLPNEFANVITNNAFLLKNNIKPRIFMGLFISKQEKEYLRVNGEERFEEWLETMSIDPFDICRAELM
jgi:hypothetical protein